MKDGKQSAQSKFNEEWQAFKTFYEQSLRKHGIIGGSFMFIHDNRVVNRQFYGTAHTEEKRSVDENTIYHWASITKTFTAIAIMQLRDRGLLKLDDPIIKYLPELRGVHNPYGDMSEITLRHLLSHSSGFRDATWTWGGDKDWHPHEPQKWEQLVAMMPYTEILFKPGSKFSYSNPGIIYLGRVIEIITHDDYEVYIDKNIFKPLEMYHSYFDATPYHLLKYRSHSYWLKDGTLTPGRFDVDTGITVSNGGLNAPLPDMVKYINFLMGYPKKQESYNQILKRSSVEEMWKPQVNLPEAKDGKNRKDFMGLTYFVEDNYDQHFIGHSGGQNAFVTHFYLNPETRTAYVVAFNTHATPTEKNSNQDTRLLDREIKENLFQNIFPLFKKREVK
ncbi:MAG: beta-lactamase family protein [Acidobacteriota bacterium]|nr:beta-lactamase family protein [Acidobacteriota bacterium]